MARKLIVKASRQPVMLVRRNAIRKNRLVYMICAPRTIRYPKRRSRVLYIGTTQVGVHRVASSMAKKAEEFLEHWGVSELAVFLVSCTARSGVASWKRLEQDLLIAFLSEHGQVPKGNTAGKNYTPDKLSGMFQWQRLVRIVTTVG